MARLLAERLSERLGRRAIGLAAALVIEALLLLLLLTLGRPPQAPGGPAPGITSFDVRSAEEAAERQQDAADEKPEPASDDAPSPPRTVEDVPEPAPAVSPAPESVRLIPLARRDMQSADLARLPRTPPAKSAAGPAYGPNLAALPGDSEVVGNAPNGEPLYAARWYREPADDEMRGYLSTASGPGWALIACRTAPDWRVEDCVGLGEYPQGSNMLRAVLAATWQFQVRPPKRGGRSLVGSWVRIRIDYTDRPRDRS